VGSAFPRDSYVNRVAALHQDSVHSGELIAPRGIARHRPHSAVAAQMWVSIIGARTGDTALVAQPKFRLFWGGNFVSPGGSMWPRGGCADVGHSVFWLSVVGFLCSSVSVLHAV
jgi:hypothetical protein